MNKRQIEVKGDIGVWMTQFEITFKYPNILQIRYGK